MSNTFDQDVFKVEISYGPPHTLCCSISSGIYVMAAPSLKLGVRVHSAVFPAGACVTPAAAAVLPDTASPGSGTVLATTWRRSPGRVANGIGNIESGHGERVAARVRTTGHFPCAGLLAGL